ncbi:MAG TPA: asparagine synthase (glutamine-hydrolyzing) [Myxococcota bacterium]|jgi:asparagine synthase (glutamine-hydrolysing)
MCGIAGFSGAFEAELLERMNAAQAHRGPDDAGTFFDAEARIGLAHRRLSIIDLSPRGHQPMWDVGRRVAISFNGEIYNYRELRRELVQDGYSFQSESDTEVLLNLYLRDGAKMLARLNGIFAFAIWDTRSRELLLARDQLGVKPLYWATTPRGVIFASEIKALLAEPSLDRELDPRAVRHHLLYLWCPAPLTMLAQVRKLEPGCALRIREGRVTESWRYWSLPYDQEIVDWPVSDMIVQVRKYLRRAVERQLVSDVPIGAFLSGGLDSSSVVALARRALGGGGRLPCFTIGFRGESTRSEGMAEDLPHAQRVAQQLDVELHTIFVGPEMLDELPKVLFHLDEPQADPAPINALFIASLARQHGIKVLLSGAGGDDVFTGYRRHHALVEEPWWAWLPPAARRGLRSASQRVRPTSDLGRRIGKAFRYADLSADERIAAYFHWIEPGHLRPLFGPRLLPEGWGPDHDLVLDAVTRLSASIPPLHRMLHLEKTFFLADHNLNYVDKVSMACGVEVRVPFLDPELVTLAARLPPFVKQHGRTGKWVLRRAMEPYVPREVIERKKTGFGAPLREWLRHELAPVVDDALSPATLTRRGLFDPDGVRRLVQQDRDRRVDATYTIFSMICIELWCRMFIDPPTPSPGGA